MVKAMWEGFWDRTTDSDKSVLSGIFKMLFSSPLIIYTSQGGIREVVGLVQDPRGGNQLLFYVVLLYIPGYNFILGNLHHLHLFYVP